MLLCVVGCCLLSLFIVQGCRLMCIAVDVCRLLSFVDVAVCYWLIAVVCYYIVAD